MEFFEKVMVAAMSFVLATLIYLMFFAGSVACNDYQKVTGRNIIYTWHGGCFVEYKGKYIPKAEMTTINR